MHKIYSSKLYKSYHQNVKITTFYGKVYKKPLEKGLFMPEFKRFFINYIGLAPSYVLQQLIVPPVNIISIFS